MTPTPSADSGPTSVGCTTTALRDGESVLVGHETITFEPVPEHKGLSIARIHEVSTPHRRWAFVRFEPHTFIPPHATPTMDYVTVVSGELDVIVPGADPVRLRPGDCIVQGGATHSWRTESEAAVTSVVVVDD